MPFSTVLIIKSECVVALKWHDNNYYYNNYMIANPNGSPTTRNAMSFLSASSKMASFTKINYDNKISDRE